MTCASGTITVRSGRNLDLANFDSRLVTLFDVAFALGRICRFTGHTARFYSVAEHSVLVSRMVPSDFALEALLHDAHEAYIGDVSAPLKKLLPCYQKLESHIQQQVRMRFGVSPEVHAVTREADALLGRQEYSYLMCGNQDSAETATDAPYGIRCLPPEKASAEFLERAFELGLEPLRYGSHVG